jgi:transposase
MAGQTRTSECTAAGARLLMALELGRKQWVMGFMTTPGGPVRERRLAAESWAQLPAELAAAKARFGLGPEAVVHSCYEAGPDGFWVHRYLTTLDVRNRVVESSSIEVNRRARRAKSDPLDMRKLLTMLYRVEGGEPHVWREVRVPGEPDEDRRQPQRELRTLKRDRTRVLNRIGGLLATQGIRDRRRRAFRVRLEQWRTWRGVPLESALRARLVREWEKVELLDRQILTVRQARAAELRAARQAAGAPPRAVAIVEQLLRLRGIGEHGAWLLATEVFAWRAIRNRREIGGLSGLTGTPYRSGTIAREQGISRAGNAQVRAVMVELAWCWLQYQPTSVLAQMYARRWAGGGPVARKIGIVAVARQLLVDLWQYVDGGVLPPGAELKPTGRRPVAVGESSSRLTETVA